MSFGRVSLRIFSACLFPCLFLGAFALAQVDGQASPQPASTATVPRLIRIQGAVRDEAGKPLSGSIGITFTLYSDENGPEAIWQENQNVQLDSAGSYSALLGASNEAGLPLEIFSAGEARWLGVRPDGQSEQPRILFLSVAYALKAADADMLGGRPASAFVLAGSQNSPAQPASGAQAGSANSQSGSQVLIAGSGKLPLVVSPETSCSSVTSDGTATANQIAKFTTACNIENSAIFESGGNVGIGNTSPAGTLDVSGTAFIRGSLSALGGAVIPPTGTATATQGYISNPLEFGASTFNTSLSKAVPYVFQWQAEPTGNDSTNTGATLNLLYGVSGFVSETGLSVAKNGILTFAPGQTFPGGSGTVTSVGTGAGLTGGPITTTGTISIPAAGVANSMLANPSITVVAGSGLSGGGTVPLGGTVTLTNTASGGTVTSVGTGAGLTGGPITTTGTISIPAGGVTNSLLANPSITVLAGSGLLGGGTVPLGGTVTLSATGGSSPTLPFFVTGGERTGATQAAGENVNKLWGFLLPYNVTTTEITFDVTTADNTANDYDIGIFNSSGKLVLDIGPTPGTTFAPSKGFHTLKWTQGSTGLGAGQYYVALTTNCKSTCVAVAAGASYVSFAINVSAGTTVGGALSSTVTPPANTWAVGNQPTVVIQ